MYNVYTSLFVANFTKANYYADNQAYKITAKDTLCTSNNNYYLWWMKATGLKSKRLEWDKDTIKSINIIAAKKGTDFKNYVQELVKKHALKAQS